MSKRNGSTASDYIQKLRSELGDAEQSVVASAIAWVNSGGDAEGTALETDVRNLLALREGAKAMEKTLTRSSKQPAEPSPARQLPVAASVK